MSKGETIMNKLTRGIGKLEGPARDAKIIQILIGPNNGVYQGVLLGLADDGVVYRLATEFAPAEWTVYVGALGYQFSK